MENTQNNIIGKKIILESFDEFDSKLELVANFISPALKNITQVDTKGLLVKYGFIDLTYKEALGNNFVRLFGETKKLGFKNIGTKNQDFVEWYNQTFNNFDSFFPMEITITDCCITDKENIWEDKHFYS